MVGFDWGSVSWGGADSFDFSALASGASSSSVTVVSSSSSSTSDGQSVETFVNVSGAGFALAEAYATDGETEVRSLETAGQRASFDWEGFDWLG